MQIRFKKMSFLVILLVFVPGGCTSEKQAKNTDCITINFDNSVEKNVSLTDNADSVKFTFLDHDPQNLVGAIINYKITDNYIILVDQQQKLFVFDKKGKLISTINNVGRGPSEYVTMEDFCIDSKERNIVILDPSGSKIIKYDLLGKYVNSYSIPNNHAAHIFGFNNGRYCLYQSARFSEDGTNLFITDSIFNTLTSFKDAGDGELLKKMPYLMSIQWYQLGNDLFYKEALNDTVFKISGNEKPGVKPHLVINFGNKRMPDDYFLNTSSYQKKADEYYQIGKILESGSSVYLNVFYDNQMAYYLYSKDDSLLLKLDSKAFTKNAVLNFWPDYVHENTMYRFMDAAELNNQLDGFPGADTLRKHLEVNDNPVLLSRKQSNKVNITR